ncbi:MAG: PadR family transcriptional regulator [Pseudanabaena sp.]
MARKKSNDPLDLTHTEEMVLYAVRDRERYGLAIIEAIMKASNGKRKIGFSSLYPTLKKLEDKGFVTSRWGDETPEKVTGARRRYYVIADEGIRALNEREFFLNGLTSVMAIERFRDESEYKPTRKIS